MFNSSRTLAPFAILFATGYFTSSTTAQDFRIYTRVVLEQDGQAATRTGEETKPVIARSTTVFHAGKVYDYMADVDELVVFEPAHRRFIVVNGSMGKAAIVEFPQIGQYLRIAEQKTLDYLEELHLKADQAALAAAKSAEFQLKPEFEEEFLVNAGKLQLKSSHLNYDVQCVAPEDPELVGVYLEYADWTARLNYLLHPQTFYPNPRLQLNAALKRLGRIPTEVVLQTNMERPVTLRAEHSIRWTLNATDRARISEWEHLLKSTRLEQVTLQEYQRAVLTAQSGR